MVALGEVLSCVLCWDLHLGSGLSLPASQPYCHQQPEMQDALALVTAEQDGKWNCLPLIPCVISYPEWSNPQYTSLCRTLRSEVLSSPVFKGRSVHCTSQDAGRAYFKYSPLLPRWKGHEYQSLSNSKGCFILNSEVKCHRQFSAASALSWECQKCSLTTTITGWTTAPTVWDQGSSHKRSRAGP